MMSYFETEDLEVTNWEGLLSFFEVWDKNCQNKWIKDIAHSSKMLDKENKTISFESWTDIKLISYWYDHYVIFLDLVAPYIEGRVEWEFESKDETGMVDFIGGKCEITTGEMKWMENTPNDYLNKNTWEENQDLKKFKILQKLEEKN